jgi:hypothetical protein
MKGSTQAALALGIGYVLGRRRKMRMAMILATAAAAGGVGGLGGTALRRGMKMLGSSEAVKKVAPQLGEIADMGSDLLTVGKSAAKEAVNNRIGSLSDSLHERAEFVRDPGAAVAGAGEAARAGAGEAVSRVRRRGQEPAGDESADAIGEEESGFEESDEPEDDERPAPTRRRTATRGRSSVVRAGR